MGTMGLVQARASPAVSRMCPGRAVPRHSPWSHPIPNPVWARMGKPRLPNLAYCTASTDHGRVPAGFSGLEWADICPCKSRTGPRRDLYGLMRAARAGPYQIHVQSRSNPARCPDWARTGQTVLAHSNPARAPVGLAIWVCGLRTS